MKIRKHQFWLIAGVLIYCALVVPSVSAHAELLYSTPAANAVLDKAPTQVELLFSEAVESQFSFVKVYDSNKVVVDAGDSSVDSTNPERMTVSLQPLSDGLYTVAWQVVSQDDGHLTAGSFPFVVGKIDTSILPETQNTTNFNLPISALIAKWLLLAALALLAGQFPSVFFIWNPALRTSEETAGLFKRLSRFWENLYWIGLIGVLLAFGLGVLAQAGQTTGHELAFPWSKETLQVLTESRLGIIWLIRMALALIGIWLLQGRPAIWKGYARFAVGLTLLLTISLTSHAATEIHPFLPVLGDWLHLVGMAFWFGGLAHLIGGLVILRQQGSSAQTRIVSCAAKRFSWMALPSVGVVGLTGLYSATLRVGSVSLLFDTLYGHALLFKQIFVAALLILAATNLLILSPGLKRDSQSAVANSSFLQHFRKTVIAEIVLACLLLGSVSVMTYLPPAKTLPPKSSLIGVLDVDDLRVALAVSPGLVGVNTYSVKLTPKRSVQAVKGVNLSFIPVQANIPPAEIQLKDQGNGIYTDNGPHISFPGHWLIEVAVRRPDKFDAIVTFDFNIPKPSTNNEKEVINTQRIAVGLIVLIGLLLVLNLIAVRRDLVDFVRSLTRR